MTDRFPYYMSAVSFRVLHSDVYLGEFESQMLQPGYIPKGMISHPLWNLRGAGREYVTRGWYAPGFRTLCVGSSCVVADSYELVGGDLKAKD